MSQDVFQVKMGNIMELCPGVISFNDDIVIYSVDRNMMPSKHNPERRFCIVQ